MTQPKRQARCPSPEALIAFVCEEEVAQATRQSIAAHLAQCPWCQEEVKAVQAFIQRDLVEEVTEAYQGVAILDALAGPRAVPATPTAKDLPARGRAGHRLAETGKTSGREGGNSMDLFDFSKEHPAGGQAEGISWEAFLEIAHALLAEGTTGGRAGDFRREEGLTAIAARLVKEGNTACVQGNYPRALSHFRQALEIANQLHHQEGIATCLCNIGETYRLQGDYPQALSHYQQALEIANQLYSQQGMANCLSGIGLIAQARDDSPQALSYLHQALGIYRQLGRHEKIAACLSAIASIYMHQDDYLRALDVYRQLDDQESIAICLCSIGVIHEEQGGYPQALSYYQQALEIVRQLNHQEWIAACLTHIGNIYRHQGDYAQALSHCSQALDMARQLGQQQQIADCLGTIGHIYRAQADYPHALNYYLQVLEINRQLGNQEAITTCLYSIGVIHEEQGNYPRALDHCSQALDMARQLGHQEEIVACLSEIGTIYRRQGDYAQALSHCSPALDTARQLGHQEGIALCLLNLGSVYGAQGDHLQALSHFHQALGICYQLDCQEWIASCLTNMGQDYLQQGDLVQAHRRLVEAITVVEQMRHKVAGGSAQQIGLFEHFLKPYFILIEGILWPQGHYGQALEYVERAKARTLLELLAEQELLFKAELPSKLVEEYKSLHRRIREIDFWLEQDRGRPEQRAAALRAEQQEVAGKLSSLLDQIQKHDPNFTATARVEPICVQDLQNALPDAHTALVELFLGREKTLAFLVTKTIGVQGVEVESCLPSEVLALAEKWLTGYAAFREGKHSEEAWCHCMDEVLQELYTRLFEPIKEALPREVRRLIFVPHLLFHLFALHAMYREENGRRVYVIEEYEEVSYAPSAAIWIRCQQRRRPAPTRLVAVENPTGDLKHAKDEVRAVTTLFDQTVILGPNGDKPATKEVFLEEASRAHVVLVVTHSSSGDPRSAHIQLSFGQKLTLIEGFLHLDLPACSLFDYSSCEPAFPQLNLSDEWITLMSAPLYAGAPMVWGGLWVVDDFATAQLKQRAYENLFRKGMSKVQALNEAQRWFLRGEFTEGAFGNSYGRRFSIIHTLQNVLIWAGNWEFCRAIVRRISLKNRWFKNRRMLPFTDPQEAVTGAAPARFALQQEVQRVQPECLELTAKHRHPFYWAAFIASGAR